MCLGSAPRRSGRAPAQRSRVRVTRHNGHRLRRPHVTPARRATSLRREAVQPSLTTERHPTLLATAARPRLHRTLAGADLTVIVPAYNEAASVADTIRSLQAQTAPPREIIVVDDCSTDGTGDVARALGVTVVRPRANTGSKAGAQTFGLTYVRTLLTVAIDADTVLAPDAIERLLPVFDRPRVAAACGLVLPRRVRSIWERGRYIEYLFAFTYYKQVQECYGKPLISSGCFSMYRTALLRAQHGWSDRTLAEDMDLTWRFYQAGHEVHFVPEA